MPRPREDNVIDVDIEVKERLTGAITFGVGYSSEDKLTGQLRLSESNLFGRGHSLALTFEKSPVRANYSLTFNEPSLFDSRLVRRASRSTTRCASTTSTTASRSAAG